MYKRQDKIVYSSVSFRYDLSAPRDVESRKKSKVRKEDVEHIDFNALASEDADHDRIPDVRDDSSATPVSYTHLTLPTSDLV